MAQIAEDIGFEESTISRAVSNKYIKCDRGIFSLKSFFTNAVSKNLSSSEIKNYIQNLIENENHDEPLTDQDLVESVMKRYNMKMVRRTITKYRKLLDVPSSKERKKIYKVRD
jgi:RNA polymerase sigma-54 factor